MELSDLHIFLAVTNEQGFTAASKKLNCVQPNVTARIKKLEEELGVQLFYRNSRDVTLTSYGKQFYEHANRIIRLSREAFQALQMDNVMGPLTIGVTQTVASAYLPKILRTYHARFPKVYVTVKTLFGKRLLNSLLDHSMDYGLLEIPVGNSELITEYSWPQKLVMVYAPDYPIDNNDVTSLVFSSTCPYRQAMIDAFQFMGIVSSRHLNLLNVDTVLACAIGSVGVTVLPERLVTRDHIAPYVRMCDFPQREGIATINLIRHKDSVNAPQAMAFAQVVREVMDSVSSAETVIRGE